ncbi:hypothetical protein HPULCUR_002305 [Helicostylum pulchrum]|uniref:DNA mismatch repair proteins mutS family domain-containing protein n=1 Tax=Helicostylum pulchrum TaxID=562976 RepID=A0ABP9XS72_9FUNG
MFLYKLTSGICEKSFDMNVAAMAGIPKTIIDRATAIAEERDNMQVDGESQTGITPDIAADLKYLLFDKKKDPLAVNRIINNFKNLDI